MALGRTGRQTARFAGGAWLVLVCLVAWAPGVVLAAEGDHVESFGPNGTAATEFSRPAALAVDQETGAVYVGDSSTQMLYKFDEDGNPLNYGGSAGYISGNTITGLSLNEGNPGTAQVAIDPDTHVVYVLSANKVRAFEANGEPHIFAEGPGSGTSEIGFPVGSKPFGLAVDEFGRLYVSDFGAEKVRIYSREGALVKEFVPLASGGFPIRPGNMAVASDGTLYITDFERPVNVFEPSSYPVTAKTTYGPGKPLNERLSASVAVDPLTQYVYISELCPPGTCRFRIVVYDESGNFVGVMGADGPGVLEGVAAGLGVNGQGKRAYAAVRGSTASDLSQVSVFETFQIPVGPPTILTSAVTDIRSSSATLRSRINPNTLETTYRFEYGLEDCDVVPGSCTEVPIGGASVGAGHNPVPVSAELSGLAPGTKYFYRVVAENAEGTKEGPIRTFSTQAGHFGSQLADDRVWEQVTPPNKFGGAVTNVGLVQADENGNGIAFHTRGSIVKDPEGNRSLELSAVLARRGGSGWTVSDLVPRHSEAGGLGFGPEFKLFSHDLGLAVFEPRDDTPLSPESSERAPNLRINTIPPSFRPLVTSKEGFANVPPGTVFGGEANGAQNPVSVSGADGSLSHIVLSSAAALVPGAQERSIYLWSDGALEPVSELPPGEGGAVVRAQLGSGTLSVRHAVSEDGSRVFWAPGNPATSSLEWPALYLRDTVANQSYRIDVPEPGVSGPGAPHPAFAAASADGSVVYFTDSQQLTEDASPKGRDLYRCEIGNIGGALGCVQLDDLTAPLSGSGESGDAEELMVGVGEDGQTAYFVARAVLDPGPNPANETPIAGQPNLYFWREGLGTRYIATLSQGDEADWGNPPSTEYAHAAKSTATNSPSGRYLVFMSEQNLAGVETPDPDTGEPAEQAFRYDATEDELTCISCNPSGATDRVVEGATESGSLFPDVAGLWAGRRVGATLPVGFEGEPTSGYLLYSPRAVLDNGRAYFNSISPLVTGDSNDNWDAYQYEPFGVGDCNPSSGDEMVGTTESGCVALISSGTDSQPSVFMDASESGDDVFFATFGRLSALDTDTIVDIYDARVNGVKAVVEQHVECTGEACQQRGLPPAAPAPGSSSFNGRGNLKVKPAKHCRHNQKKVRRKGKVKCVPRSKKGGHHKKGGSR